jgi:hypothetical protein
LAHFWFRDDEDIWSATPLDGRAVDVSVCPPRILAPGFRLGADAPAAVIRAGPAESPVWALLAAAGADVRVNGFEPVAGVAVLQDRDEIRAGPAHPLFFSTETIAHVEEFPGAERAIFCGRCRQPMLKGQLAVRCPNPSCGIWYHQTEQLPCWTYAPTCAFCPQPTALDAGFAWTPEA